MNFTANQWAILALVLVLGWLLGMFTRSGGARWREAYEREHAAREVADARDAAARRRIIELERQTGYPIGPGTAASVGAAASGQRDDLALIRGIGRARETSLNEAGIHRYRQIEEMSEAEAIEWEDRFSLAPGTIAREQWREQAGLLDKHRLEDHRERFS